MGLNSVFRLAIMDALEKAIENAGGLSALANMLGVKPQVVQHWRKRGVPAKRVLAVEAAGRVPRHELRSDLYPAEAA